MPASGRTLCEGHERRRIIACMNWNIFVLFANDDGNEQEPEQDRERKRARARCRKGAIYTAEESAEHVLEQEPEREPTMLYDDSDDT